MPLIDPKVSFYRIVRRSKEYFYPRLQNKCPHLGVYRLEIKNGRIVRYNNYSDIKISDSIMSIFPKCLNKSVITQNWLDSKVKGYPNYTVYQN
jgi:hypothetical protein